MTDTHAPRQFHLQRRPWKTDLLAAGGRWGEREMPQESNFLDVEVETTRAMAWPLHTAVSQARRDQQPGESLVVKDASSRRASEISVRPSAVAPPVSLAPREKAAGPAGLSPRQRQVAELRAEGYTVMNIAAILGCSEGTVKTHLNLVRRKLNVVSAVEICLKLRQMQASSCDGGGGR